MNRRRRGQRPDRRYRPPEISAKPPDPRLRNCVRRGGDSTPATPADLRDLYERGILSNPSAETFRFMYGTLDGFNGIYDSAGTSALVFAATPGEKSSAEFDASSRETSAQTSGSASAWNGNDVGAGPRVTFDCATSVRGAASDSATSGSTSAGDFELSGSHSVDSTLALDFAALPASAGTGVRSSLCGDAMSVFNEMVGDSNGEAVTTDSGVIGTTPVNDSGTPLFALEVLDGGAAVSVESAGCDVSASMVREASGFAASDVASAGEPVDNNDWDALLGEFLAELNLVRQRSTGNVANDWREGAVRDGVDSSSGDDGTTWRGSVVRDGIGIDNDGVARREDVVRDGVNGCIGDRQTEWRGGTVRDKKGNSTGKESEHRKRGRRGGQKHRAKLRS